MQKWIVLFTLLLVNFTAKSTHIVGGEFIYEWKGGNNYKVTFDLFRDCINGSQEVIDGDETGSFGIFDNSTNSWFDRFSLTSSNTFIVPPGFSNACIKNPPQVCLNRLRFTFNRTLPLNTAGYTIVYQRCCRNQAKNVNNNQGSQVGATYFTNINPQFGNNNSGVPKFFPPQIICINNPLIYDASLIDSDGDSLSYELCDAKDYNDIDNANPSPTDILKPPYPNIPYSLGFSGKNPMTANPILAINSKTGIISGTPTLSGRFVVTVCASEWRNGNLINVNRLDFQFEVTNCSKTVVANTPVFSQEPNTYIVNCQNYDVKFFNSSVGGFDYSWDFGVQGISTDFSTQFEPNYTYPDTGTFLVTLVVNKSSTCPDSLKRIVKIYPKMNADFDFSGKLCPGELIKFTDKSTALNYPILTHNWNFDDGTNSSLINPTKTFSGRERSFKVTLITKSGIGCLDTARKEVKVPVIKFSAGDDTTVLKNVPVQLNASTANTFLWSPNTFMDNPNLASPTFIFPDTGLYVYVVDGVTKEGCFAKDSINVFVAGDFSLLLPTAFSPNGDNLNDALGILQAGYGKLNYFRIFDRWGKALFYTTSLKRTWDGNFNDKPCEQGVYFWMASATNILGQTKMIKGDFMLTR
jgi:gliding motility-associated-like protein